MNSRFSVALFIQIPMEHFWFSFVKLTKPYGLPQNFKKILCFQHRTLGRNFYLNVGRLHVVWLVNQIRMICSHIIYGIELVCPYYFCRSFGYCYLWMTVMCLNRYWYGNWCNFWLFWMFVSLPTQSLYHLINSPFPQNRCVSMQSHIRWPLWALFPPQFLLIFRNKFESVHMILLWFDFFDMDKQSQSKSSLCERGRDALD